MLLYEQLQEGIWDELLRCLAVSGAVSYPELCMAAKSEEQRQAELKNYTHMPNASVSSHSSQGKRPPFRPGRGPRECYTLAALSI